MSMLVKTVRKCIAAVTDSGFATSMLLGGMEEGRASAT